RLVHCECISIGHDRVRGRVRRDLVATGAYVYPRDVWRSQAEEDVHAAVETERIERGEHLGGEAPAVRAPPAMIGVDDDSLDLSGDDLLVSASGAKRHGAAVSDGAAVVEDEDVRRPAARARDELV